MSTPPTYLFHVLSSQTKQMAKNCGEERLAFILKNVALGSLILMTGFAAKQVLKEVFEPHTRPRSR
jgi:hypothetical protein